MRRDFYFRTRTEEPAYASFVVVLVVLAMIRYDGPVTYSLQYYNTHLFVQFSITTASQAVTKRSYQYALVIGCEYFPKLGAKESIDTFLFLDLRGISYEQARN